MNLVEITVSDDLADETKTKNILLNLDEVVAIKLPKRLLFNPERKAYWLIISTTKDNYTIHNEAYAVKLYLKLKELAIQEWTQEKLS